MKMKSQTRTQTDAPRRRKSAERSSAISRDVILDAAFDLTAKHSVEAVSMVRVAKALGVSPPLIHYYLDGRDDLTSGILNRWFKAVDETLPDQTGDWRRDVTAFCNVTYELYIRYPGIADYLSTQTRFRLEQKVQPGEVDHGIRNFEYLSLILMRGGFTPSDAAIFSVMLRTFVRSAAYIVSHALAPHSSIATVRRVLTKFPEHAFPGLHFGFAAYTDFNNAEYFQVGLSLLLDGFAVRIARDPLGDG